MEAVPNHELEVGEEHLGVGVLVAIQLLPHRRKVHRFLDDLGVGRNIQGNVIYEGQTVRNISLDPRIRPHVPTGS